MPLSEKDKIVKAVDDAYLKNKDRLIKFFSDKGFNKSESTNLAHTMRNAVYFLETHEYDRHDIEISLRNEIKEELASRKKEIVSLMDSKNLLKDIIPEMDWDAMLEFQIKLIDEHEFNKTRAGKNKSLHMALEPLFWRFARLQSDKVGRSILYLTYLKISISMTMPGMITIHQISFSAKKKRKNA